MLYRASLSLSYTQQFVPHTPPPLYCPSIPTGSHQFVLYISKSASFLLYSLVCCIFQIPHISDKNICIFFNNVIYFWLRWVFVAAHGLSLVVVSGGYSSLRCAGFSLQSMGSRRVGFSSCSTWAQQLWHAGPRAHRLQQLWHAGSAVVLRELQSTGSVVVVHGLSCSVACGIFPEQGLNPCPLHQQEILNHCATREVPVFLL